MNNLIFPKNTGQRYYPIHYQFVLDLFRYCGWNIEFDEIPENSQTVFQVIINNKPLLINFADNGKDLIEYDIPTLQFHYNVDQIYHNNVISFTPVSFYYDDWKDFDNLENKIHYTCNNNIVLNNQRAYGNAIKRRIDVRHMLSCQSMFHTDFVITDQHKFWNKINNCLVSVCVPGQNEYILDRGAFQYMYFGCCIICPEIKEILPYNIRFQNMVHYIKCEADFSDLTDKIKWCLENRQTCIDIGNSAKKLCKEYFMPESLINWIKEKIND